MEGRGNNKPTHCFEYLESSGACEVVCEKWPKFSYFYQSSGRQSYLNTLTRCMDHAVACNSCTFSGRDRRQTGEKKGKQEMCVYTLTMMALDTSLALARK